MTRALLLALLLSAALPADTPPPPPAPEWRAGALTVTFEGGTLHLAVGFRGAEGWPLLCAASPCAPALSPGDAVAVIGPGGTSAVVLVPARWRLALPVMLRGA